MKIPTKREMRRLAASLAIVTALAASSAWATDRIISDNYTLSANETVDGVLTVASGVTVDLDGHRLTVQGLAGDGTITSGAFTISDLTSPDTTGTHVTWSTKAGDATGANGGSGANLFNNVGMSGNTSNNDNRILVPKANLPLVVTYDFGEGMGEKVNKYKIYHLNQYLRVRGPRTWTLEGLNDLSDDGITLDSQSGVTWSSPKSMEFTFDNDTAYRYYRITITESSESGGLYGDFLEFNQLEYFDTSVQPELHISVPEGASATNSTVAISGSVKVVKEGEGEFAEAKAGQTYTGGTILSEGTYALASTASLDWLKFTFGTDPAKPVTLAFGAEATLSPVPNTWHVGNIANITSTVYKTGGDWSLGELTVGQASGAVTEFYHSGGSMSLNTLIIGYEAGSHGTLEVGDGGTVTVDNGLIFNYGSADCTGVVNLKSGGVLGAKSVWRSKTGSATFNFDGGTFKESHGDANIFSANSANTAIDVFVSENGGTIDNNGFAITIPRTITGAGGLTFIGTGTTRVFADQSYLGTTVVSNGTTLSVNGVTFKGPVAFASGSTLNVASYTAGFVPLSTSALTLPAEGSVGLTLNGGAFPVGVYAICSATDVTEVDGAKFAPSTGGETASWKVVGDRLILTVGTVADNYWTELARDGDKMSTTGNWADGTAPADGEDVDFSSVTVTTTIDADIANVTFGAVTMGSGAVVFANDNMTATSFSDLEKVAVAENSTVTLDGDLVFGTNVESKVCRYVFEGGKFVVTGKIIATPEQTKNLYPCENAPGWISAKGLVNNAAGDKFFLVQADNWQANWMIGEDGISGANRYIVGASGKGNATIKATADFAVSSVIIQRHNLVLVPDGHVITLGTSVAAYAGGIISGGDNGLTTVTGPGKVVVNYNVTNLTEWAVSYPNAFTVTDGGTLAIVPGAKPSVSTDNNGTLTVNSGATLEVAESGTVTLGSNLTLADGAALGFNYTARNEPVLNLTGKTVTFDEGETTNVVVKVSAKVGVWPKGGANVLTSGGKFAGVNVSLASGSPKWVQGVSVNDDGNIVLTVKSAGTRVIIR